MKRMNFYIILIVLVSLTFSNLNAQDSLVNTFKTIKGKVVQLICYDIDKNGTGFVIDRDGYLLTANHVVANYVIENNRLIDIVYSDSIYAIFNQRDTLRLDLLISRNWKTDRDPWLFDFAILKIDNKIFEPLQIGKYDDVDTGDEIIFSGFPLSSQHLTNHTGIISAKYVKKGIFGKIDQKVYQIDGSINKGNSGGPLISLVDQKVIGIISTREGGISNELDAIKKQIQYWKKRGVSVTTFGVDQSAAILDLINTLDIYISVGIGHAVSIEYAIKYLEDIKNR